MVKLRTDRVPAFFGEHVWNTVDDVVEVAEADAAELLKIVDGAFHEVVSKAKGSTKNQVTEPDPDTTPSK